MLFFFLDKAKDIKLQDIGVKIKNQGKYLNSILIVLYTIYCTTEYYNESNCAVLKNCTFQCLCILRQW